MPESDSSAIMLFLFEFLLLSLRLFVEITQPKFVILVGISWRQDVAMIDYFYSRAGFRRHWTAQPRIRHSFAKIDSVRFTARKYHSFVGIGNALEASEAGANGKTYGKWKSETITVQVSYIRGRRSGKYSTLNSIVLNSNNRTVLQITWRGFNALISS